MTQVDFYILSETAAEARHTFACRLTDKAYRLGHRVYIHTASATEAEALDEYLWTFQPGSFVPHGLVGATPAEETPVLIGHGATSPDVAADVLLNLSESVPDGHERFARLAEVVDGDDGRRQRARERFRRYRELGYAIKNHDLSTRG